MSDERDQWWEHEIAKWNALAGKTIARVEGCIETVVPVMTIHFTDGTSVEVVAEHDEGWEIRESKSDALPADIKPFERVRREVPAHQHWSRVGPDEGSITAAKPLASPTIQIGNDRGKTE